ncbi:MAG: peptidyl-prolyl cis-trans isomerase [Planctomycetes bacterium]|nr:peptidyl-prolyl cis-trans isomerase [Planctomycetota bacterium]
MKRFAVEWSFVHAFWSCVGLAALIGCGGGTRGPLSKIASKPDAVLLRVNGEAITRADLDLSVGYLRSYLPGDSRDDQLVMSALQDDLLPTTAIRGAFKDRIPPLLEKAKAARARILGGEDFAAIARAESDDKLTKAAGGDMGRKQRGDLVAPLARVAFTMKEGEVSEPVLTVYGIHIIKLTKYWKGATPLDDAVDVSQIDYAFGSGLQGRLAWEKVLADAAGKIEVVDPAMADLIPGKFKAKPAPKPTETPTEQPK